MKKKTVLIVVLIVCLAVIVSLLLLFSDKIFNVGELSFKKSCEVKKSTLWNYILDCPVLVGNSYKKESQDCFIIRTFGLEQEVEDHELCVESELVDWVNPYSNYDKYIPVNMAISGDIFGIKEISISLLADADAEEMFIDSGNESLYGQEVRIKENEDILYNGYHLFENEGKRFVNFSSVKISDIKSVPDGIEIGLIFIIKGENVEHTFITNGFTNITLISPIESTKVEINSEDIDLIDQGLSYNVIFELDREINEFSSDIDFDGLTLISLTR